MSTSSGWLIAKATARANDSAGMAYALELPNAFGDIGLGDAGGQFRFDRARRDDRHAEVPGLHFLP